MDKFTKQNVMRVLGLETDRALGEFFGISQQAANSWPPDDPIPMPRQWELRAKFPKKFPEPR